MYDIETFNYGYKLTFSGMIKEEEMTQWLLDCDEILKNKINSFHVFVDMRELKVLDHVSKNFMKMGQNLFKRRGMIRSVVICDSLITTMQFKRIAKETGIYEWERYIDSSSSLDFRKIGMEWLLNKTDPDN